MNTLHHAVQVAILDMLSDRMPAGLWHRYLDHVELADAVLAVVQDPGRHHYLSTGCLHGDHDHCRCATNTTGQPKIPGVCKFCAAPCECRCHRPATGGTPIPVSGV